MEGQRFSQELRKIFENPEEGGERLTIKSLRDYMAKFPPQLRRSRHFVTCFYNFLVEKLNASDCQDPALVAFVINFTYVASVISFTSVASVINFTSHYEDRSLNCLHYLDTELDRMFHTNPSSVPEGVNYKIMWIETLLRDRKLPVLKLLLRYGVIPPMSPLDNMAYNMVSGFFLYKIKTDRGNYNHLTIDDHLKILYNKMKYPRPKGRFPEENACILRRKTVAIVIGTLYYDDSWNPEGEAVGAKCLKYYFEAIPEPFVVVREMENLIFEPQSLKDILDVSLVKAKFDRYNILFPDWNVLEPRSLKHLSRCAARSHLCRQGTLPDVISKLPLPNVLKDYLLLKNVVTD